MSSLKNPETVAIIPFYNESGFVEHVINAASDYVDLIIAVDDGSTDIYDHTVFESPKVLLIRLDRNHGKGFALNTGFQKSIELNTVYTITLDADLQHPPELIPQFLNELHHSDIVIGARRKSASSMPPHRRLSNFLTTMLLSVKTGRKFSDSQSGYRGFKTAVLTDILPSSNGFEAETEILINAAEKEISCTSIPIPTIYNDSVSKMQSIPAILGFIKVILR